MKYEIIRNGKSPSYRTTITGVNARNRHRGAAGHDAAQSTAIGHERYWRVYVVVAARVPGLAYLQNFDGRGKHDTKFSYFQEKNMLRVELPRHRYPVDRTLFSIISDI